MPDSTEFLYSGTNPVQTGVDAGVIQKERVTVIRGRILGPDAAAVPGVKVTVLGHPEFGQTLSRADGLYDLAVNGGAPVTLNFSLAGYLTVQRQVPTPWRDFSPVPDVVLTALDSAVTVLTAGATATQVARGTATTDDAGTRQATLILPAGTTATMTLPDGGVQSLSTMHVRATEFTVGDQGPLAMPASLPPRSGYTYAVELSVDEALAQGGERIQFNQAVPFYVENFLHFPVGSPVPVGYYDRTAGLWRAEANGLVVKVLSVAGGMAELDVDGSGQPATSAQLATLGIADTERQKLATLYPTGTPSLWRVALSHFTPWDCNWPYGPPEDADYPSAPPEPPEDDPNSSCTDGSIIECENSVLREELPLVGTDQYLAYRSDRVQGRIAEYSTTIHLLPLPPKRTPGSLAWIHVQVIGAGQYHPYEFPKFKGNVQQTWPATMRFTWDGNDGYGRQVNGPQKFRVRVGYEFGAIYQAVFGGGPGQGGASFGQASGQSAVGDHTRVTITLWMEWEVTLGTVRHLAAGLGGWSLSGHHTFDPEFGRLFRGDGTRSDAIATTPVFKAIVGGGGAPPVDGGRALGVGFASVPSGAAMAPDGTLVFIAYRQIWRVTRDSTLELIAGDGASGGDPAPFFGDGQPAATVTLPQSLNGLAIGPDGTIYFTQYSGSLVRKVSPDGILSTVAGNGLNGDTGDGGPALEASLFLPQAVALDADGNLYIGEWGGHVVRRVDVNGNIKTVAGNGQFGPASSEGLLPTNTPIGGVKHLAVGPDGALYVCIYEDVIWRFDPSGRSQVVFGGLPPNVTQSGFTADGQLARGGQAVSSIEGIAVLPDGRLVFAETGNHRLRMIDSDGTLLTLAGNGNVGNAYSGAPATGAPFTPWLVTVAPDGTLYTFANNSADYGYQLAPVHAGFSIAQRIVGSPDGSEAYIFDSAGRHQQTVDALTGTVVRQFGYDAGGRLSTVTDANGNALTIRRDGSGTVTGIDAPFGQHTAISIDSSGYFASVSNPANESVLLVTNPGGLLTSLRDPKGQVHAFEYDALGRLTKDSHPSGGFKRLDRTRTANTLLEVDVTTALGRRTVHQVSNPGSSAQIRTVIRPDGSREVTSESGNYYRSILRVDGSTWTVALQPDGRFGVSSPLPSWTLRMPSGLIASGGTSRSAVLSVAADPLSLTSLTTTSFLNGRAWTETFDVATRTRTLTTPLGKRFTVVLDSKGRVTKTTVPGVSDVSYGYDANGRLQALQQGARTVSLTFGADGLPLTSTDALNRITTYTRDAVGRMKVALLPVSRTINFGYDSNGILSAVTPPGRPLHQFDHNSRDDVSVYTPPPVTSPPASPMGSRTTVYGYDLDGALTSVSIPDSTSVVPQYDVSGRLATLKTARTTVTVHYAPDAGQVVSVTDPLATGANPTASDVGFAYDGPLLTGASWSGEVNGAIGYTYNQDLQVVTSSVLGMPSVTNSYDFDLMLSTISVDAGTPNTLTLSRDPQNGLLTGTSVGIVATTQGYDSYGAMTSLSVNTGAATIYSATLTPDGAGRIQRKVETVQGVAHTCVYTYDDGDRLTDVSMDGATAGHWSYDGNGNRLTGTAIGAPGTTLSGTYDAQDRLISYGGTSYVFGPNGDLQSKTSAGQTTSYAYDTLGALASVVLSGGDRIDYVLDALGRRVGEKLNGILQRGWLYEGIRPVAEVDAGGSVVARFIYGTRPHVPDLMLRGSVLYRLVADERGSVRLVVNASTGTVVQRLDYDAWGNVTADSAPGFQPFGYAGGLWDSMTRLIRFGTRDYDPETGRWTNKDPLRFDGGDTNLYLYAGGDPVNLIDPSGLSYLYFNPQDGTISVFSREGYPLGTYPAGNNTTSDSRGPWDPGVYKYERHTTHPDDAIDSAFGSFGNYIFTVPGCVGCGVHSGRVSLGGPTYVTKGCVRTTDQVTDLISALFQTGDPLTTLFVGVRPPPSRSPPIW